MTPQASAQASCPGHVWAHSARPILGLASPEFDLTVRGKLLCWPQCSGVSAHHGQRAVADGGDGIASPRQTCRARERIER
jgi:hypothetical protein